MKRHTGSWMQSFCAPCPVESGHMALRAHHYSPTKKLLWARVFGMWLMMMWYVKSFATWLNSVSKLAQGRWGWSQIPPSNHTQGWSFWWPVLSWTTYKSILGHLIRIKRHFYTRNAKSFEALCQELGTKIRYILYYITAP